VSAPAERPLRSNRLKSGIAVGLASRVVRFLTGLVLARAIILRFGPSTWGILALSLSVADLVVVVDFAIRELCVYEAAASRSRAAAQHALDQALLVSTLPAALGTLVLVGCAAAGASGFFFAGDYAGRDLALLFLAAAVAYPFAIAGNVYTGTLQGFGWIRELNAAVLATIVLDLAAVLLALRGGLGIVGIQWARAAVAPVSLLVVVATVRRLGLPLARPERPDRAALRGMLGYCVRYNVNRGLGSAVVASTIPIAQRFVPASTLGSFGAADQWAGKLRKVSEVVWESMFHRLVRCFRGGASDEEREDGRLQFLALSLGMSLVVVPAGVALVLVAPWLFRVWLDAEKARLPLALLPGLVAAWCLNSTASPSTCAILASNRFRLSARVHAVALALNVGLTLALTRIVGIQGAIAALVATNAFLALVLSLAACRVTGASWWRWLRSNSIPYGVAVVVLWWHARVPTPGVSVLAGALSVAASVAVGLRARSFRSFREILSRPGGTE